MDFLIQAILWVTAVAQFVVAVMSFINGGLARKTIVGALAMMVGAVWTVTFALTWELSEEDVFFANQVVISLGMVLMYFFCLLGMAFQEIKAKYFYISSVLMALPIISICLSVIYAINFYIPEIDMVVLEDGSTKIRLVTNPLGFGMIAFVGLLYVGIGTASLVYARKHAETARGKKLIRNVIIGLMIGFWSPMIFNLANAEIHEVHWIGPVGLLAMAILVYTTLTHHGDDEL